MDIKERKSQNPERFKVRDGKVYPDGSTTAVDLATPGFGQREGFDADSEEAVAKAGGSAIDLTKPVDEMTHAELDAYAASQDPAIDLTGATTRQDKIDKINDASA